MNSVTENYSYDSADKLTGITGGSDARTFTYDAAGRTTGIVRSGGTTAFSYDYESRVTSITKPGMTTNSFSYNGLDTRVGSTDSTGTKSFKRAGVGVTAPVLSDGTANFTPSGEKRGSTKTTFHSALKNGDVQTNSSQVVSAAKQFDAFGNELSASGSWKSQFGYAGGFGYQSDPDSGLKLLGHRYYDSDTGRFLTRDPVKDGRNWYGYCGNNPVSYFDAVGLWKAIIIVGHLGLTENIIKHEIIAMLKSWLKSLGATVIVVLEGATEQEIIDALSDEDVEGFAYLGHGLGDKDVEETKKKNGIPEWFSPIDGGKNTLDRSTASKIAKKRKKRMRHAIIFSCNSTYGDDMWYDVADMVYTWDHEVNVLDLLKHNYIAAGKPLIPKKKIGGGGVKPPGNKGG